MSDLLALQDPQPAWKPWYLLISLIPRPHPIIFAVVLYMAELDVKYI